MKSFDEHSADFLNKVFEEIKHGDQDHQAWLKNKLEELKPDLLDLIDVIYTEGYEHGGMLWIG